MKQQWPAPERNKGPILDVLRRALGPGGALLEIASGSGQHAAFFAAELPGWTLQPSDMEQEHLDSIRAWVHESKLPNLRSPLRIDVQAADWGIERVDAIFNANMIHIAPWSCCVGLIQGAGRLLSVGGRLILYGPYRIGGAHTAESNARFDDSLKSRDPSWGVRNLEDVVALAAEHGLALIERVAMPANNQTLVFEMTNRP